MKKIRFYRTKDEGGFLSNFWAKAPFEFEGHTVQTSEALYQALKVNKSDPTLAVKILTTKNPGEAARLGRDPSAPLRADWEAVKNDAMRIALMAKFCHGSVDEGLMKALLATGDAELIEDSPIDWYWGVGKDNTGKNILGVLLMELRDFVGYTLEHMGSTALGFELNARFRELSKTFSGSGDRMFAPSFKEKK
jgi:ribA/ribD-fused uncharacterized protein